MAEIDYDALAEVAAQLLSDAGRFITVRRIDQAAADANEPWKGPSDPEANPSNTSTVKAVFVPPSSASELGMKTDHQDLMAVCSDIAIVTPGGFDFAIANQIVDNGQRKAIAFVEKLQPSTTTLLYYIGVKR